MKKCCLCENELNNAGIHRVQERVINKGDAFNYAECLNCGSWTMIDEIDISAFYPSTYNPYLKPIPEIKGIKKSA